MTSGLMVDFCGMSSEQDEVVYVFGPSNIYLQYEAVAGWCIGESDKPWLK